MRWALLANFENFTPAERKKAEALLLQIDGDLSALADQKNARKEIEIAVANAIQQGLSQTSETSHAGDF